MDRAEPAQKLCPPLQVLRRFRQHDLTLPDFLASRISALAEHELIAFEGKSLSYRQVGELIVEDANDLVSRGVKPGDRICVMASNHPAVALLLFAAASIGAIMVPLNPTYSATEAAQILRHAEPVGIMASPEAMAVIEQALAETELKPWLVTTECRSSPTAIKATPECETLAAQTDANSVCLIIYTSGTTGTPKGVMHTQRSVVLAGEGFVGRMYLQPGERLLCVLPMFHINALMYSLAGAIACGGTFLPIRRFSASTFWQTAVDTGATEVNLVGSMAHILANRPRAEYRAGHRIWRAFAAPITPRLVDVFRDDFGIDPLIECYGMSEIPGVLANPFAGLRKTGSLGVVSPHADPAYPVPLVKVVSDNGDEVIQGEIGELAVRTQTLMQGYFRAPEETAAAFRDGWFMTGDLVRQDADGYFYFIARRKDIIRRRGENISGAELDQVLADHPDIAEAAAIPVPSALGEDDILVAVVPRAGADINAENVSAWMRARLSPAKQPRYVAFVDALPRTATQRIEKYKLRADTALLAQAVDLQAAAIDQPTGGSMANDNSALHNVYDSVGAITEEVLTRFKKTPDPRLREIMLSLISHLHSAIREVDLTREEWRAAMDFLAKAAAWHSDTREEFVALSDVLGVSMLVTAQSQKTPPGATVPTLIGPFYLQNPRLVANGGDVASGASGVPLFVSGRVRTASGKPIAGACVDVWHSDAEGLYDLQHGPDQAGKSARGRLISEADGRYWFWRVLPTAYPAPDNGALGDLLAKTTQRFWRPAHMHYYVTAEGYRPLITQAFVRGGEHIDEDAAFGVRPDLIVDYPRHEPGTAPDGRKMDVPFHTLDFDIVMVGADAGAASHAITRNNEEVAS